MTGVDGRLLSVGCPVGVGAGCALITLYSQVSDTRLREFVGHCAAVSEQCLAGDDRKGGGQHSTIQSVMLLQLTHYSPPSVSPRVLFVCSSKHCVAAVTADTLDSTLLCRLV